MSEIKYGLISRTDANTLEKTIDLICDEFRHGAINITEIGLFDCGTAHGIWKYFNDYKYRLAKYIGIDNEKDKPISPYPWLQYIKGNSTEVYNQLEDNSQHLIFIDGDHSFIGVISDFYAYADKVKVGGYLAFHDTGKHIKPFKDFQHGDKNNPDAYISVRKALDAIGLFQSYHSFNTETDEYKEEMGLIRTSIDLSNGNIKWQLIFDEADETDEAGGICVFKKLY